jgi:hypothetical protein
MRLAATHRRHRRPRAPPRGAALNRDRHSEELLGALDTRTQSLPLDASVFTAAEQRPVRTSGERVLACHRRPFRSCIHERGAATRWLLVSMQLSRATDQADPTGALLLPVEAVASAEPAQTLARDEQEEPDSSAASRPRSSVLRSSALGLRRARRSSRAGRLVAVTKTIAGTRNERCGLGGDEGRFLVDAARPALGC